MNSLEEIVALAIDSVAIHSVWPEVVGGETRLVKKRRLGMGFVIAVGNIFLRLSKSRIRMFPRVTDWRTWECHSFALLHGAMSAGLGPKSVIWTRRLEGQSLAEHFNQQTIEVEMLHAAGESLKQAHLTQCPVIGGPWSHGDPHLRNLLYDAAARRVHLLDFETIHEPQMTIHERHADDVLVVLLDILGRSREGDLPRFTQAFCSGYGVGAIRDELLGRIKMPSGLELVLWHTRTSFVPRLDLRRRLEIVRGIVSR